jgi:D-alanyl-lipoteichoic acid acyltransferase DltB (MBOAT superfamily)
MLIIALWHGASWNFVAYGLLHGTLVGINRWQRKRTGRRPGDPMPHAWGWVWRWTLTFHFIVCARILFKTEDLAMAKAVALKIQSLSLVMPTFQPTELILLACGFIFHFTPTEWSSWSESWFKRQNPVIWAIFAAGTGAACMISQSSVLAFVYYDF